MRVGKDRRRDGGGNAPAPSTTEQGSAAPDEVAVGTLIDALDDGIALVDPAGRIAHCNRPFAEMLRLDRSGAEGVPLRDVLAEALGSPASPVGEWQLADGRSVRVRAKPLPGGFSVCIVTDVGHERHAEPRHRPGKGLLREALDSVDASIVLYDADDRYLLGNRRYHELYPHLPDDDALVGESFEQMLRRTIRAGAHTETAAITDAEAFIARRLAERAASGDSACERLHPSGRWDLIRTQTTPSGCKVTLRVDITQQKRLQEALARAKQSIEIASVAKSRFLAAMSHELRTPLNAIIGFAELLVVGAFGPLGSPRYRGYAEDIKLAGEHLLVLINDVLDLMRIESGKVEVRDEVLDLIELTTYAIALVDGRARANRNAVTLDATDELPQLRADHRLVRQMLLNLLSNAVKFTRDGQVTVGLSRSAEGGIEITVCDTGIGMPREALASLGEPFFQVHESVQVEHGGTGLGLAIVRELIGLHGGTLSIESVPGKGTRASLHFPPNRSVPSA